MSMYGGAMAGFGGLVDEGAATPAGTPRATVNGVPQPVAEGEIVVAPNGTAIRIPAGYVAEAAENGNGIVYRPAGSTGDANTIRIMGPDKMNPNGYAKVFNSAGQPIDPSTLKQGTSRAAQHIQF